MYICSEWQPKASAQKTQIQGINLELSFPSMFFGQSEGRTRTEWRGRGRCQRKGCIHIAFKCIYNAVVGEKIGWVAFRCISSLGRMVDLFFSVGLCMTWLLSSKRSHLCLRGFCSMSGWHREEWKESELQNFPTPSKPQQFSHSWIFDRKYAPKSRKCAQTSANAT